MHQKVSNDNDICELLNAFKMVEECDNDTYRSGKFKGCTKLNDKEIWNMRSLLTLLELNNEPDYVNSIADVLGVDPDNLSLAIGILILS